MGRNSYFKKCTKSSLLTGLFLTALLSASAQKIVLNDTLIYRFHRFYAGKELKLGFGCSSNRDFAYVFWGYDEPSNPVDGKWANSIVRVEEVYYWRNKPFLMCIVPNLSNKFNIDIQQALDHHELE